MTYQNHLLCLLKRFVQCIRSPSFLSRVSCIQDVLGKTLTCEGYHLVIQVISSFSKRCEEWSHFCDDEDEYTCCYVTDWIRKQIESSKLDLRCPNSECSSVLGKLQIHSDTSESPNHSNGSKWDILLFRDSLHYVVS